MIYLQRGATPPDLTLNAQRALAVGAKASMGNPRRTLPVNSWTFLREDLDRIRSAGLYRDPDDGRCRLECAEEAHRLGVTLIEACSNDYLGYVWASVSRETIENEPSLGAGASRLIHGTRGEHRRLEACVAQWVDQPSALLFASGYSANVGVMSSLPQAADLILSDELNHASIIDGCRLSKAEVRVFPHLDVRQLEATLQEESPRRRCWVVTESYFSMDGDSPDLGRVRALCDTHRAPLIVDEAHAIGVFGPEGSGLCRQSGLKPDVMIGTFGKAIGSQGSFVCADPVVREWLWNRARSFVYSTATSPLLADLTLINVERARRDDAARARLNEISVRFRERLRASGVTVMKSSHGPIVPVVMGAADRAVAACEHLLSRGILVQAIRPPTVAKGSSRLRVTLNSGMTDAQLERLAMSIVDACAK